MWLMEFSFHFQRMREGQKSLAEQHQKEHQATSPTPNAPHQRPQSNSLAHQLNQTLDRQQRENELILQNQALGNKQRSSSSDSFSKDDRDSPILNLSSHKSASQQENGSDLSADDDVYVSDNDDDLASNEDKPKVDKDSDRSEDKVNNNGTSALPTQVSALLCSLFVCSMIFNG